VIREEGETTLAGVPVEITWAALGAMEPVVSGITGPDGRFRFPVQLSMDWVEARALPCRAGASRWGEPPPGSARAVVYNPAWKAAGGRERKRQARDPGEEVPLLLALPAGGRVAGRVVDEEGQPVAGARVQAWKTNAMGVPGQSLDLERGTTLAHLRPIPALIENETRTDGQGRFLLEGVLGRIGFAATASGFDAVRSAHATVAAGALVKGVELRLAEARAVTVEVRDLFGLPAPEFTLLALPVAFDTTPAGEGMAGIWYLDGAFGAVQVASPADAGRIVFPHLTHSEFMLRVYDGPALVWEGPLDPDQSSIRITLVPD